MTLGAAVALGSGSDSGQAGPRSAPTSTIDVAPSGSLPYGLSGDPADYGPRGGLPARRPSGSVTVTESGTVVQNLTITGSLDIQANNVTVRNVAFVAPSTWTWQQANNFISVASGYSNVVIEDVSFDGRDSSGVPVVYDAVAGYGRDVTVRRCDAQRVGNMIEFSNGLVEDCYLHDIWQAGPASGWHADGIQSDGGDGITVREQLHRHGPPTGRLLVADLAPSACGPTSATCAMSSSPTT